jgi:hypothetical protein
MRRSCCEKPKEEAKKKQSLDGPVFNGDQVKPEPSTGAPDSTVLRVWGYSLRRITDLPRAGEREATVAWALALDRAAVAGPVDRSSEPQLLVPHLVLRPS